VKINMKGKNLLETVWRENDGEEKARRGESNKQFAMGLRGKFLGDKERSEETKTLGGCSQSQMVGKENDKEFTGAKTHRPQKTKRRKDEGRTGINNLGRSDINWLFRDKKSPRE